MKHLLGTMLLSVLFTLAHSQTKSASEPAIKKVTALEVKALIDSSNEPLIVNFWATWCGPCVRELGYFDSIIVAENATVRLVLVSLDFPESYPKKIAAFVKSRGYKGEVVYLNETNADKFIPVIEPKWNGAIPASIFVSNNKKYYQLFNNQLTRQRFTLELRKLVE